MPFSSNDLYPVVFDLQDLDHDKDGNRCRKNIVATCKEKASTAAASILSSTIFCGHDITFNNNDRGVYPLRKEEFSEQREVSTSDQERQDHHGQAPATSGKSSQLFAQSSQNTIKQIVFAEPTSRTKHRHLEDEYVMTQQVRLDKETIYPPRLAATN
jgi:hypothetical protein